MRHAHRRPDTPHESLVHYKSATFSSGLSKTVGNGLAMPVADRGPQISLVRKSKRSMQAPDRGLYGCRQKKSDSSNGGVVTFQHPNAHSNPHRTAVSSRTSIFAPRGFLHRGLSNACPIVPARVVVPALEGRHRTTLNVSSHPPGGNQHVESDCCAL